MSTTSLFVELLIVGIQATIWCALIAAAVIDPEYLFHAKEEIGDWETIVSILYLSSAYAFGIIIDRVADVISYFLPPQRLIMTWPRFRKDVEQSAPDDRIRVLFRENKIADLLEFIRVRLRLIRATTLNLFLITCALVFFLWKKEFSSTSMFISVILGIFVTGLSAFAQGVLECTYQKRLRHCLELHENGKDGEAG